METENNLNRIEMVAEKKKLEQLVQYNEMIKK